MFQPNGCTGEEFLGVKQEDRQVGMFTTMLVSSNAQDYDQVSKKTPQ